MDFLERHTKSAEVLGFWDEQYKSVVVAMIESNYKKEIIKEWQITDIIANNDKFLLKWRKRLSPLTNKEYNEKYN